MGPLRAAEAGVGLAFNSAAADDCRQCLHLPVVGMIINSA
jgi:hypothetical protein